MMLLRWISAWFSKPSTATRIRSLEEQTRLSEERTARIPKAGVPQTWERDAFPILANPKRRPR